MLNHEMKIVLSNAKNPLVLAVGGGNDSVSTLMLQKQLQHTFNYYPNEISVVAVLPDCLDYQNLQATNYHPLINIIQPNSTRSVQGHNMSAFPERILSANKEIITGLKIKEVYGISMSQGSIGIAKALIELVKQNNYDMILAIDVGGDFIAVQENVEVLSPMMDGYMLYALKQLEKYQTEEMTKKIPIIYSVFGLGTDGESTPEMLNAALSKINEKHIGQFDKVVVKEVIDFYRDVVEKNRYSRTTDFTIQEIEGSNHDNPSIFRGRFHVQEKLNEKPHVHYGIFTHIQDPSFFGKYYLFTNIDNVQNPFAIACHNGVEWFIHVQNNMTKINHELNGQSYGDIAKVLGLNNKKQSSLLFGTPSRKFNKQLQAVIAQQIVNSIKNDIYDSAIIYTEQWDIIKDSTLYTEYLNNDLVLIGKDKELLNMISAKL